MNGHLPGVSTNPTADDSVEPDRIPRSRVKTWIGKARLRLAAVGTTMVGAEQLLRKPSDMAVHGVGKPLERLNEALHAQIPADTSFNQVIDDGIANLHVLNEQAGQHPAMTGVALFFVAAGMWKMSKSGRLETKLNPVKHGALVDRLGFTKFGKKLRSEKKQARRQERLKRTTALRDKRQQAKTEAARLKAASKEMKTFTSRSGPLSPSPYEQPGYGGYASGSGDVKVVGR